MNNNFCQRCGAPINQGQSFCPMCGNNVMVNNQTTGKLIINRVNNFYGCAANLKIIINGCTYSLGNNMRLDFDLMPGVYVIEWKAWCRRKKMIQINVMAGNWYQLEFKPDYFWGGFKLSDRCKFY